jgi:two-component system sensor histidine kinase DegS
MDVNRILHKISKTGASKGGDMLNVQTDNPNVITSTWPIPFADRNKIAGSTKTTVLTNQAEPDRQSDKFINAIIKENDWLSPTVKKAFKAQEEERARISGELHDTVAQWLVSASYHSQSSKGFIAKSMFTDAIMEMDRVNDITSQCIREIRRIIMNLSPHLFNELGLVNALRRHLELLGQEKGIECDLVVDGKLSPLPWTHELTIYRVILEALNNIKKHAKASRVEIRLRFYSKSTQAIIVDNGSGFDFAKTLQNVNCTGSIGLLVMHERAEMIGGDLKIESTPGLGTRIVLEIPVGCK